jgi:hypothetical protein
LDLSQQFPEKESSTDDDGSFNPESAFRTPRPVLSDVRSTSNHGERQRGRISFLFTPGAPASRLHQRARGARAQANTIENSSRIWVLWTGFCPVASYLHGIFGLDHLFSPSDCAHSFLSVHGRGFEAAFHAASIVAADLSLSWIDLN